MPQVGNVTGLQTRTGWGHGLSWVRVRVPNLNPRKTRTRDTGLTSIMGVASNCYCYITGWSSLVPSISNHILASGDHENKDSEREEQWRQVDNDRGGIAGVPWVIIIITALFTDYTRTAEVQEAARRVSTPLLFHYHCTTEQRQSQAPATTGDRQQHTRKEQRRCEEVGTSSQHCSFLFDTARRCIRTPPHCVIRHSSYFRRSKEVPTSLLCRYSCFHHDEEVPTSSSFLFLTQRGGTHLLVVSLFLFSPRRFHHNKEVLFFLFPTQRGTSSSLVVYIIIFCI